jgi:molybdopterin-guanine dinucleotide biosynthesis protein A
MSIETTGIILAGGHSRRMGQDKCRLRFGGVSLLEWVIGRVAQACRPVMVVAAAASDYPDCGAAVLGDQWPDAGPLGGLQAGLAAAGTAYAAVVACDLPFVEPAVLAGLVDLTPGWDVVVPVVSGRPQPLYAVYSRAVERTVRTMLRRGDRSLRQLLVQPGLRVRQVGEEELRTWDPVLRSLMNINTPDDYERARGMLTRSAPA